MKFNETWIPLILALWSLLLFILGFKVLSVLTIIAAVATVIVLTLKGFFGPKR